MPARRSPLVLLVFIALASGGIMPLGADDADRAERERELEELRARIVDVRRELAADRERRDDVGRELERVERRVSELAERIAETDTRITASRVRLDELATERQELAHELARHSGNLGEQVRAAWRLGRQPALRLVLRQDDPAALSRAMAYYGYFNRARVAAIEETTRLFDRAAELEREAAARESRLAADRAELGRQRERIEAARVERQEIIARLDRDIEARGERLSRMEENRARLERLLDRLGSLLADIPAAPPEARPFGQLDGQLGWPAEGRIRQGYGSDRAGGRLRWQGIVIDAAIGDPVQAIHRGRVVFADWLSGFGQLIIIDHQDGYLSLYGYNERLLRTEGDWVAPGEVIAAVGDSGGQREPGLYFEIRREGRPVDPVNWLASR